MKRIANNRATYLGKRDEVIYSLGWVILGFEDSNPHIGFPFCLRDARELEPGIRTQELETVS